MNAFGDLPVGSYIRFKYRGGWDYAKIVEFETISGSSVGQQMVGRVEGGTKRTEKIPPGATINEGVWKRGADGKEQFAVRRTFTHKP